MSNPIEQLDKPLQAKLERCRAILRDLGSVAVGFSSGVDSTLLLSLAADTLGVDNVLAVTNISSIHPRVDHDDAARLSAELGIEWVAVEGDELANPDFTANSPQRCYYCKREIFGSLCELARRRGLNAVVSGANADDPGDYRPGSRAETELGVRRPLMEADLNKAEIRAISAALGLPTADKPAMACLASRIPYGQTIDAETLQRIEQGESALREMGFRQYRVRDHGKMARVELPPDDLPRAFELRSRIVDALKAAGYLYVSLDLEGFVSGSLNKAIGK